MKAKSNTEDRTQSEETRLQEIKRRNPTQTTSLDYFLPKPPLKGGSQTLEDESQRLPKRTQTPSKKKKQIQELLEDFDPLKLMLNYASPSEEKHWKKLAKQAHTKPLSGIKLHCIDCCGGSRKEAARCDIRTCALWPSNLRIFGAGERQKRPREETLVLVEPLPEDREPLSPPEAIAMSNCTIAERSEE